MGISKDAWNHIRKRIKHLSQTAEYLVLKEFQKLDYLARTYYYTNHDPVKGEDVVRELDFQAYNMLKTLETQENTTYFYLAFLGDVKFHVGYKKFIILGLKIIKSSPIKEERNLLNEIRLTDAIQSLYSEGILAPLYTEIITEYDTITPICRHVLFFNPDGTESKNPDNQKFRAWCEQIVNAFYNLKQRMLNDPSDEEKFVDIPLLVFGNEAQFVMCHPEEADSMEPTQSDAFLYLFQPSKRSPTPRTYLTPIVMTSLQKLPHVIPQIEQIVCRHIKKHLDLERNSA